MSVQSMRIPEDVGPCVRMDGGYTQTYISSKHNRVFRYCDKYYSSNRNGDASYIQYSTISDLILLKSFEQLKGFPRVYNFMHDEKQVRVETNYLGKTLTEAVSIKSIHTRMELVPHLLNEISYMCLNLLYNGIQHTDLKPTNILIDSENKFHLIDFNCMSISHPGSTHNKSLHVSRTWYQSVGTWNYVAPEILWGGHPHDNSMVWSIGMVAMYWILGTFPISHDRMKRYLSTHTQPNSQDTWKKLMHELRRKYPKYMRIESKYQQQLHGWYEKLVMLLHWNPHKRPTLEQVLRMFHIIQPHHPSKIYIKPISFHVDPSYTPSYIREDVIEKGYAFLQKIYMESLLVSTIILFDRVSPLIKDKSMTISPSKLFIICWAIHGFMTNNYLFDDDSIVLTLYQMYQIQCDEIFLLIFDICHLCQYQAWQREWYWYVHDHMRDHKWTISWEDVKLVLITMNEPYDSQLFAKKYLYQVNMEKGHLKNDYTKTYSY